MEVIGYFAAFLIGLSLGLIGGGGSILTVPVLVYLFGISPLLATSYSLVVVGVTSFTASIQSVHKGLVDYKTVLLFGIPSIITVFITRKFILPSMPAEMEFPGFHLPFPIFTMLLFAVLMVLAAVSMIKTRPLPIVRDNHGRFFKLTGFGIIVGLITGFLGAGGGFILIPALVLVFHLPMQKAIGSSLFIIAANSLVGYAADFGHYQTDYHLLLVIVLIAVAGAYAGARLNTKIDAHILKSAFGWFVLAIGCFIFVREIMLIH
jgi:uncharacterized membrane protein YfcA